MKSDKKISRLIFLHVDKYRSLSNADFLFDPSYDVQYIAGCLKVNKRDDFPTDFYDVGAKKAKVVTGLAAIIGLNGAGKTTVATLFKQLSEGALTEAEGVILLAIENGKIVCRTDISFLEIETRLRIREVYNERFKVSCCEDIYFLYHNPHAAADNPFLLEGMENILFGRRRLSDMSFIDVSSSGIIGECAAESRQDNDVGEVPTTATDIYRAKESARFFRTLIEVNQKHQKEMLSELMFPAVNGVLVRANQFAINALYARVKRNKAASGRAKWKFLSLYENADNFVQVFISYVATYVLDLENDGEGVVESYFDFQEALVAFCSKNITRSFINSKKMQRGLHRKILFFLKKKCPIPSAQVLFDFFLYIEKVFDEIEQEDIEVVLPLDADENGISIKVLLDKYYAIPKSIEFVNFYTEPILSAGEMAYMSIFSRIYPVLTDWEFCPRFDATLYSLGINPRKDPRHVVLFMDEVETALHPELQRRIVKNLILFLEMIGEKNLTVQLIFASHSPILLSDIPSQSVTILDQGKTQRTEVIARRTDTFASNIFDLFRLAFDLKDGTFGSFATDKINKLLEKTAKRQKLSENERKLAMMVGDNYFRRYLLNSK